MCATQFYVCVFSEVKRMPKCAYRPKRKKRNAHVRELTEIKTFCTVFVWPQAGCCCFCFFLSSYILFTECIKTSSVHSKYVILKNNIIKLNRARQFTSFTLVVHFFLFCSALNGNMEIVFFS